MRVSIRGGTIWPPEVTLAYEGGRLARTLPRGDGERLGCGVRQRFEEPFAPASVGATGC
jgi:hypothetical protein